MANLRDLLLLGSTSTLFTDNFSIPYVPAVASTLYTNAFNGWDIISNGSARGYATGSELKCSTVGTGSASGVLGVCRDKESYSLNGDFELSYSLYHTKWANINYSYNRTSVSMCGLADSSLYFGSTSAQLYGLEIRAFSNINGSINITIWSNGVLLGTPYTGLARNTWWYVFAKKQGNTISITVNSTGVKPTTYAFNYTITDFTMISNYLSIYMYTKGEQDWGAASNFDNLSVLLL